MHRKMAVEWFSIYNYLGATGLTWLAADHLYSTSGMITASDYSQATEIRYTPWGETRYTTPNATIPTDRKYTGQREEAALGLYFYNARWYDPSIMQFTQPDSIIPDPYNPIDWNRYAYARGNPVRYSDPSGHLSEEEIMNYFGVTEWDQVLAVFEKGGALEGRWGWLATLRDAEVGDKIKFVNAPDDYHVETLFNGTLAAADGTFYLLSDWGPMSLTLASSVPCNGYIVIDKSDSDAFNDVDIYKATFQDLRYRHDPNKMDLVSAGLDATSVFASLIGANTFTNGAKAATAANKVGQGAGAISLLKSISVDQTPNSVILSLGGLIPFIGGGFSLASLFYDFGFYYGP